MPESAEDFQGEREQKERRGEEGKAEKTRGREEKRRRRDGGGVALGVKKEEKKRSRLLLRFSPPFGVDFCAARIESHRTNRDSIWSQRKIMTLLLSRQKKKKRAAASAKRKRPPPPPPREKKNTNAKRNTNEKKQKVMEKTKKGTKRRGPTSAAAAASTKKKKTKKENDDDSDDIHVLLIVTGSVAAIKWWHVRRDIIECVQSLVSETTRREGAMVRVHAVATDAAKRFIGAGLVEEGHPEQFLQKYYPDGCSMEEIDGIFDKLVANAYGSRSLLGSYYNDTSEWQSWRNRGDAVTHIDLRNKADICVIAPCSANTLAKVANGMCDNLATSIIRAWDFSKPLLIAPAMNTHMWQNPITKKHIDAIKKNHGKQPFGDGVYFLNPIEKTLACGDSGVGAMCEPKTIAKKVKEVLKTYFETGRAKRKK